MSTTNTEAYFKKAQIITNSKKAHSFKVFLKKIIFKIYLLKFEHFFFRIDYGFQGVVKRFGFKGMPASHGVTKTHRRVGNIGGGGEKGRVWPGTKMPGRMGSRWRINKGLQVLRTYLKYNVMWVQGSAVPGPTGGIVYLYDTILPHRKKKISSIASLSYENIDKVTDDIWSEKLHRFKDIRMTHKNE